MRNTNATAGFESDEAYYCRMAAQAAMIFHLIENNSWYSVDDIVKDQVKRWLVDYSTNVGFIMKGPEPVEAD